MSILQEYEMIRRQIGEDKFNRIVAFLEAHPDLYLSDVYYKTEVWAAFEEWDSANQKTAKSPEKANLCATCIHNVGATTMNCEYACAEVSEIENDGEIVVGCNDYAPRSKEQ